jgi:hypothetical protein
MDGGSLRREETALMDWLESPLFQGGLQEINKETNEGQFLSELVAGKEGTLASTFSTYISTTVKDKVSNVHGK